MDNEALPYRTSVPSQVMSVDSSRRISRDEDNHDTLKAVGKALRIAVDDLDKWHAFDLTETELKLKQQVKAHQLCFEILTPLLDSIESAIEKVDNKYKER